MKEHENEEPRVETIEPQRKLTRKLLAESNTSGNAPQRNKYVLVINMMAQYITFNKAIKTVKTKN